MNVPDVLHAPVSLRRAGGYPAGACRSPGSAQRRSGARCAPAEVPNTAIFQGPLQFFQTGDEAVVGFTNVPQLVECRPALLVRETDRAGGR